jgi:hypothetical protein
VHYPPTDRVTLIGLDFGDESHRRDSQEQTMHKMPHVGKRFQPLAVSPGSIACCGTADPPPFTGEDLV